MITFGVVVLFCVGVLVIAGFSTNSEDTYAMLRGYCKHVPPISKAEFQARRFALRDQMIRDNVAAFITEPGPTMNYLVDVRWSLSERPFLLVVKQDGSLHFVCPAFERGRAVERISASPFPEAVSNITLWVESDDPYQVTVTELLSGLAPDATVAIEPETRFMIGNGLRRHLAGRNVINGLNTIRELRMVKSPAELDIMRCVSHATKKAIRIVSNKITFGKTEAEISQEMNDALRAANLRPEFHMVAFGANAAHPHGTSNKLTLQPGMLILIDAGATLHGYQSDVSRTFAFGIRSLTERQRIVWETVRLGQQAALDIIKPGVTFQELDTAAREFIEARGFGQYFTHRLGHGIGLQGHEEAYVVQGNTLPLRENMTFTVEPGIYIIDEMGVRIEDVVRVTRDGYEVLGPLSVSLEDPVPVIADTYVLDSPQAV